MSRRALLGQGAAVLAALVLFDSRRKPDSKPELQGTDRVKIDALVKRFGGAATPAAPVLAAAGRASAPRIIFIDPGHGGVDEGAVGTTTDGRTVREKDVALAIAKLAQTRLEAAGFSVVLSRTSDTLPDVTASDLTPDGQALTSDGVLNDLQRRIDRANASGAELFLSIHLNANEDPAGRGSETYYDSTRPFAADNLRFAQLVQQDVIAALRAQGYNTPDRGVIDDTLLDTANLGALPDDYNHLVLLGPAIAGRLQPTQMPGALNEALFLTSPVEATAAADPNVQALLASGYAQAVSHYFALS